MHIYKPIGVPFDHEQIKLIAVHSPESKCDGCHFFKENELCNSEYNCVGFTREDKKSVILKKV